MNVPFFLFILLLQLINSVIKNIIFKIGCNIECNKSNSGKSMWFLNGKTKVKQENFSFKICSTQLKGNGHSIFIYIFLFLILINNSINK